MLTVGLTEAKRRFEELVERAGQGERIRITRYGKLKAEIAPSQANRRGTSATRKARKHPGKAPSRSPQNRTFAQGQRA
jgi:prevent-host-death family protein